MDVLYRQAEEMVASMADAVPRQLLADAQDFFRRADPDILRGKLRQRERGVARIPWLVAVPINVLAGTALAPPLPTDLSVIAADGSSVSPNHHSPLRYCVLNIGYAILTYGGAPSAILDAQVQFCSKEDELCFDPMGKRIPIEGTRLGIWIGIQELEGVTWDERTGQWHPLAGPNCRDR